MSCRVRGTYAMRTNAAWLLRYFSARPVDACRSKSVFTLAPLLSSRPPGRANIYRTGINTYLSQVLSS